MALIDDVKLSLRISSTDLDIEVQDLIDTAKAEMTLTGIDVVRKTDADPLIKRAIITYCKANFDTETQESDRLLKAYQSLKEHLSFASDYMPLEE